VRVFVTGASGLIGGRLAGEFVEAGHEVVCLSRRERRAQLGDRLRWTRGDPCDPGPWTREAGEADAVFHLAGESIASGRWTAARKRELARSRIGSTQVLVDALAVAPTRPAVLVCASACGYYGARGEELLTETSGPGSDFLARLCVDWEAASARASAFGIRVVQVRFGVVLSAQGGALATMLPLFRLGLGGPLGPGDRWFPWVSEVDAVGLLAFALAAPLAGPLNVASPEPVRMQEFARTLGSVLHRPALLPVPELALKVALGEMGGALTPGQRVVPDAAVRAGYCFREPTLGGALRARLA
jgi:hypothetical protein